jgi:hypothetical protein
MSYNAAQRSGNFALWAARGPAATDCATEILQSQGGALFVILEGRFPDRWGARPSLNVRAVQKWKILELSSDP